MPHIHVEYSDNVQLNVPQVLAALNAALFASGHVSSALDIKSRALCQKDYLIGFSPDPQQAYVHVKLSILTGRSLNIQQQMSAALLQALQQNVPQPSAVTVQLCVEVLEMEQAVYSKAVLSI
ncbi:5-carboxymethyl-2-hydroxymuconate Delta-isomerase [Acinetobacter tianfuensis]|uniref:5-carboxymethyl-2-hydroxymuconate isomerase n=1 Tax=Acinetobacter tianfuensis TaxID=2419603 RepID=A0A3A8E727_9GAMM|nr:5-carboxymethyl-2-hydroxymuconate isomerase [Acinetobacter tianfuensis]RKG29396.1 5-carboxymethyl-2-hydroxymuconate isomerase [Acinetobacter tianfuensis]